MSTRLPVVMLVACAMAYQSAYALNFVAYGDTRTDTATHHRVVNRLAQENPELVIHDGDLGGSDALIPQFTKVIAANTTINALWQANNFLVARGNHETWSGLSGISPTMVRGGTERYSFTQGNCFFVSMGYDSMTTANMTWMATQLSSAAAKAAYWRIVWEHIPIYSSCAEHPANGTLSDNTYTVTAFRTICDTTKVTVVFYGHSHAYERSNLIYQGVVTNTASNIPATAQGTVYVQTGGGGAPLYAVISPATWRNYGISRYHYCFIQAGTDSLICTAKDTAGTVLDQFIIHRNATAVNPRLVNHEANDKGFGIRCLGKNIFTVTAPAGTNCTISDVSGRVIIQKRISAEGERIDLSRMKQGLCIARINFSGQTVVRKVVVW